MDHKIKNPKKRTPPFLKNKLSSYFFPPPGLSDSRGMSLPTDGGNVTAAKVLSRVNPVYPPLARQTRISGTVRLHAIIAKNGTVRLPRGLTSMT